MFIHKRRPTDLSWIEENSYSWELDPNEPNWEEIAKYWEDDTGIENDYYIEMSPKKSYESKI